MTVKPLPPDQFVNVLLWAAAALNHLEDRDHDQSAERERSRLRDISRDRQQLSDALAALRDLVGRYGNPSEVDALGVALRTVEYTIGPWLEHERSNWLRPQEGRPRRIEFDHFAQVILSLAEDHWSIRRAAFAVAAVIDSAWKDDPRTRARAFAKALWGTTYSSDQQERVETLAEELRQRAQDLKRSLSRIGS